MYAIATTLAKRLSGIDRCTLTAVLMCASFTALPVSAIAGETQMTPLPDLELRRLDGKPDRLGAYRGQVLLIVNVASECGYTPQYEGLQALYERYRERGFSVLGFPSNDFGAQEPGSDEQIGKFCRANYGVEFPMFSKCTVLGDDAHPLYRDLNARPDPIGGAVTWNFEKYLVDRDGRVVARFEPEITPQDPQITKRIEELLAAPNEEAGS